jgi:hypothetical protein
MGGVTNKLITKLGCKKLLQGEILTSAPRNALTHSCALCSTLKVLVHYIRNFSSHWIWLLNLLLKIWEFIGTPSPKKGVYLGVCEFISSHFLTLLGAYNMTPKLFLGSQPCKLLCLGRKPKVRVVTKKHIEYLCLNLWKIILFEYITKQIFKWTIVITNHQT